MEALPGSIGSVELTNSYCQCDAPSAMAMRWQRPMCVCVKQRGGKWKRSSMRGSVKSRKAPFHFNNFFLCFRVFIPSMFRVRLAINLNSHHLAHGVEVSLSEG